MRGGRAPPQPQQHVHVEPEDGQQRHGQRRGEEGALQGGNSTDSGRFPRVLFGPLLGPFLPY